MPFEKPMNKPQYMAQEVVNECYTEKADIWAMGIVTYELLSKLRPFESITNDLAEIYEKIQNGSFEFEGAGWREVSD